MHETVCKLQCLERDWGWSVKRCCFNIVCSPSVAFPITCFAESPSARVGCPEKKKEKKSKMVLMPADSACEETDVYQEDSVSCCEQTDCYEDIDSGSEMEGFELSSRRATKMVASWAQFSPYTVQSTHFYPDLKFHSIGIREALQTYESGKTNRALNFLLVCKVRTNSVITKRHNARRENRICKRI